MTQKPSFFQGGSTAGEHPVARRLEFFVAPTSEEAFNTVRVPLVAVACWRMNHALFDFDSSFVSPETKAELPLLAQIVDGNPGCPAAIFGHADPTGDDEHNKRLSGRRARAIHALLTRDLAAWEDLFSTATNGDSWGLRSTKRILQHLVRKDGSGPYLVGPATNVFDAPCDAAVRAFQTDQGLSSDGMAGRLTREALYREYMDDICLGPNRRFVLDKDAFILGDGAKDGKGAFQGCSEFNPVHLLSRQEASTLGKEDRDAANAPNRRVMVFLFRKGTKVDRADWPCPLSDAPTAGCRASFWPDGDARRASGDDPREYRVDRHTMACRFYDRLARTSPCEGIVLPTFRIRLFDIFGERMTNAIFELSGPGIQETGTSRTGDVVVHNVPAPSTLRVRWGRPLDQRRPSRFNLAKVLDPFEFDQEIHVDVKSGSDEQGLERRLGNLGYGASLDLRDRIKAFQRACDLEPSGIPGDAIDEVTLRHDQCRPPKERR
jgi:peptidoglycan hydrolase-like protein with peptidoglycan-binding domain